MIAAALALACLAVPASSAPGPDRPDAAPAEALHRRVDVQGEREVGGSRAVPAPASSGLDSTADGVPPSPTPGLGSVVVAPRPAQRDRTQATVQVDGEALRRSARATTFEALSQASPGLYVSARGALHGVGNGASGGIHLRGLGGSPNTQILVMEDGVPDYQGIFGHPIPDAYVPFLIGDALIIAGGDSVLFGTNAMGGVIAIRGRFLGEDGLALESDTSAGSFATMRQNAALLGKRGALDYAAGLHLLTTDGHRAGAGGSQQVASIALRYRFDNGSRLAVRNKLVHVQGADPGPVTHPTPDHTFDVWRDALSLQLTQRLGPARLQLTPYLNVGLHRLYDGFQSIDAVAGAIGEVELRPRPWVELLLGLSVEHIDGSARDRIEDERLEISARTDFAFYNQLSLRPLGWLQFTLGTRELVGSQSGFVFLYKAGTRVSIGEHVHLQARLGRNYRQPTLREKYLPFPVANPDLRPELARTFDVGAGLNLGRLSLTVSIYRTEARDMIRTFGVWPSAEVVNVGRVAILGVEGRAAIGRLGPISLSVGASWQDVGRYTRQNPELKVDLSIQLGQRLGPGELSASVSGQWVHGLFMSDYGRDPIDDPILLDASLGYRLHLAARRISLEPYLLLRNLLDREQAFVEGYTLPGFEVMAGLRLGL